MKGPRESARAEHVVLVSIDAFLPEFCQDETWPAPTLQQLAWEGAYAASVRTVFPSLTYPAHATIVTGALPARHGVFFNEPFEPEGRTGRWYWEAEHIRARTIWSAVRDAGGTVAAVGWPVTLGAAIDWNVPDVWPIDPRADTVTAIRAGSRPSGLLDELEREATGRLRDEVFGMGRLAREDRVGAMAAYLFEKHRPALLLMHLIGPDHVQHERGRSNPLTRRSVGAADRAIGQVLEAVERLRLRDRTAFIITGDHGSADVHTEIRPNVWLVAGGLMEDRPDRGDWTATFHASGGSAFLRLRKPDDREPAALAKRLLEERPQRERGCFRVIERDELDRLGADPDAAFALAAMPGVTLSSEPCGPAIRPASGGAHGYHPDEPSMMTGFVASGSGIRRGAVAPVFPLQNVASLVAALLGLDFEAPDGLLFEGLLESRAPSDRSM